MRQFTFNSSLDLNINQFIWSKYQPILWQMDLFAALTVLHYEYKYTVQYKHLHVTVSWAMVLATSSLLPPANEVCKGYVFTRVCHSVHRVGIRGRGACEAGGMHGRGCAWQGACVSGGAWWGCACMVGGMRGRYYEIRSMSGWYASYWNAFLLFTCFVCCFVLKIFGPQKSFCRVTDTHVLDFCWRLLWVSCLAEA